MYLAWNIDWNKGKNVFVFVVSVLLNVLLVSWMHENFKCSDVLYVRAFSVNTSLGFNRTFLPDYYIDCKSQLTERSCSVARGVASLKISARAVHANFSCS